VGFVGVGAAARRHLARAGLSPDPAGGQQEGGAVLRCLRRSMPCCGRAWRGSWIVRLKWAYNLAQLGFSARRLWRPTADNGSWPRSGASTWRARRTPGAGTPGRRGPASIHNCGLARRAHLVQEHQLSPVFPPQSAGNLGHVGEQGRASLLSFVVVGGEHPPGPASPQPGVFGTLAQAIEEASKGGGCGGRSSSSVTRGAVRRPWCRMFGRVQPLSTMKGGLAGARSSTATHPGEDPVARPAGGAGPESPAADLGPSAAQPVLAQISSSCHWRSGPREQRIGGRWQGRYRDGSVVWPGRRGGHQHCSNHRVATGPMNRPAVITCVTVSSGSKVAAEGRHSPVRASANRGPRPGGHRPDRGGLPRPHAPATWVNSSFHGRRRRAAQLQDLRFAAPLELGPDEALLVGQRLAPIQWPGIGWRPCPGSPKGTCRRCGGTARPQGGDAAGPGLRGLLLSQQAGDVPRRVAAGHRRPGRRVP